MKTGVEWLIEQVRNNYGCNGTLIEDLEEQAKVIEEAWLRFAIRLGAGSLSQWTHELEEAILKEFKSKNLKNK
jgi:hypothetical protein